MADRAAGKEKDMFTMTSALYLKNERTSSPVFDLIREQDMVFMCRNQVKQKEDLCKERRVG